MASSSSGRTTRSVTRAALSEVIASVGHDVISLIGYHLIRCQPLSATARAACTCKDFGTTFTSQLRRLRETSKMTLVKEYGNGSFNIARHAINAGDGILWACDMNNHRVLSFDLETGKQKAIARSRFEYPWFLAARGAEVFVAETSGSRISVYNRADGVLLREWRMRLLSDDADVLIADEEDHRVRGVWTQGIAVDGDELYAARPEESAISVHDTTTGARTRSFSVDFAGAHFGISLALIDGRLYLTRPQRDREEARAKGGVRVYARTGTLLERDFCRGAIVQPDGLCEAGPFVAVASYQEKALALFTRGGSGGGVLVRRISLLGIIGLVNPVLISADDRHIFVAEQHNIAAFAFNGWFSGPMKKSAEAPLEIWGH